MDELREYGIVPVQTSVVAESLSEYRAVKDKISSLEQEGSLIRLKNGLYVVSSEISNRHLSLELIANRIYGPSYVSFETALWYHGLIPERVYLLRSAVLTRGKRYNTPLGGFEYIRVPEDYFSIGIQHKVIEEEYAFMIASPEKALCDLIIATKGLRIQSLKAMREYIYEDIRLDIEAIDKWDLSIIESCIQKGRKRMELNFLYKLLNHG